MYRVLTETRCRPRPVSGLETFPFAFLETFPFLFLICLPIEEITKSGAAVGQP